jgi:putative ABC transport system substrate-binding protein
MIRLSHAIVLGLLLATWASIHAQADEPDQRTVQLAFVGVGNESTPPRGFAQFWSRLAKLGWTEGRNLKVQRRWAEGRPERLPGLMSEMVELKVDVIVTQGTPAAIAAKQATSTIPIVAMGVGDAVGTGLAATLAHPGGNLTGLSHGWLDGFGGKWLELLQESLPQIGTVAVIFNPASSLCVREVSELEASASSLKLKVQRIEVHTPEGLSSALGQAKRQAQGVIVLTDPLTWQYQREIAALALKYKVPSMYANLEFADAGGLMAYGIDLAEVSTRSADYVDKVLRGAKPGDLPMEQSRIVFVVNLRTAKALGITVPQSVLIRADEVLR